MVAVKKRCSLCAIFAPNRIYFLSLIALLSFNACNSKTGIAYVNPNKLLQGYHGATAQHTIFQGKAKVWQQRIDSLGLELQALGAAPAATRAGKEQQLQRYHDAVQQQAQQENKRATQAVLDEINVYIKLYGKEKEHTFIFGATESGNIVYAAEGMDITDEVLKGLNSQYDSQHPQ